MGPGKIDARAIVGNVDAGEGRDGYDIGVEARDDAGQAGKVAAGEVEAIDVIAAASGATTAAASRGTATRLEILGGEAGPGREEDRGRGAVEKIGLAGQPGGRWSRDPGRLVAGE